MNINADDNIDDADWLNEEMVTCLCLSLVLNLSVESSQVCAIKVSKDQLCCLTTLGSIIFQAVTLEKHLLNQLAAFISS